MYVRFHLDHGVADRPVRDGCADYQAGDDGAVINRYEVHSDDGHELGHIVADPSWMLDPGERFTIRFEHDETSDWLGLRLASSTTPRQERAFVRDVSSCT